MSPRVATLKQLVADSTYPIDEAAIAEAIVVRTLARRAVPDLAMRCAQRRQPAVRSFRPHSGALSFRLARPQRRSPGRRTSAPA